MGDLGGVESPDTPESYEDVFMLDMSPWIREKTLAKLRDRAYLGKLGDCRFRSIAWKVFLEVFPISSEPKEWPSILDAKRQEYSVLRRRYVDERVVEHADQDVSANNPLSRQEGSAWARFFEDTELQKEIMQDVERTYPELEFFREEECQRSMGQILFVYSRLHPSLSYRQGMHELLAPFYYVLAQEARQRDETEIASVLLDREFIEADAFILFSALMESTGSWYAQAENPRQRSNGVAAFRAGVRDFGGTLPVRGDDDGPMSPVHDRCRVIYSNILKSKDPTLYEHLEQLGIPAHVYLLRWLRVLMGREFHLEDLLLVWDAVFADGRSLDLVDFFAVAMLMYIRVQLLHGDENIAMRRLFKYPPVEDVVVLIDKALLLRETSTSEAALELFTAPPRRPTGVPAVSQSPAELAAAIKQDGGILASPQLQQSSRGRVPPPRPPKPTVVQGPDIKDSVAKASKAIARFFSSDDQPREHIRGSVPAWPGESAIASRSGAREPPSEVERLRLNQLRLANRVEVVVNVLQGELLADAAKCNREFNEDNVFLAIAELKIVKDVLNQSLPEVPENMDAIFQPSKQLLDIQNRFANQAREEQQRMDFERIRALQGGTDHVKESPAQADPYVRSSEFKKEVKEVVNPFLLEDEGGAQDRDQRKVKSKGKPVNAMATPPPFFEDVVLFEDEGSAHSDEEVSDVDERVRAASSASGSVAAAAAASSKATEQLPSVVVDPTDLFQPPAAMTVPVPSVAARSRGEFDSLNPFLDENSDVRSQVVEGVKGDMGAEREASRREQEERKKAEDLALRREEVRKKQHDALLNTLTAGHSTESLDSVKPLPEFNPFA